MEALANKKQHMKETTVAGVWEDEGGRERSNGRLCVEEGGSGRSGSG